MYKITRRHYQTVLLLSTLTEEYLMNKDWSVKESNATETNKMIRPGTIKTQKLSHKT